MISLIFSIHDHPFSIGVTIFSAYKSVCPGYWDALYVSKQAWLSDASCACACAAASCGCACRDRVKDWLRRSLSLSELITVGKDESRAGPRPPRLGRRAAPWPSCSGLGWPTRHFDLPAFFLIRRLKKQQHFVSPSCNKTCLVFSRQ